MSDDQQTVHPAILDLVDIVAEHLVEDYLREQEACKEGNQDEAAD